MPKGPELLLGALGHTSGHCRTGGSWTIEATPDPASHVCNAAHEAAHRGEAVGGFCPMYSQGATLEATAAVTGQDVRRERLSDADQFDAAP
jgi:hypothetical protein